MEDQINIEQLQYYKQLLDLIHRANMIKIMLWAGDVIPARQTIKEIKKNYGRLIEESLRLKMNLLAIIREHKSDIEEAYRREGAKGWELDYFLSQKISELTSLDLDQKDLFIVSPIASIIERLDRRISEEIGTHKVFDEMNQLDLPLDFDTLSSNYPPVHEHKPSGFRYLRMLLDENQWELRAYRLDPLSIRKNLVLQGIKDHLGADFEEVEGSEKHLWPIWGRIFLQTAFIDLTLFDPGRIQVNLTIKRGADAEEIFQRVLDVIAKSQT